MEDRKRNPESRVIQAAQRSQRKRKRASTARDTNEARREKYASDPAVREKVKKAARETYRKDHPLTPSKTARGLRLPGQQRELFVDGMDHPVYAESYTIPEAAEALGRSVLGFKRWITDGLVPPPVLRDTVRGYKHYSRGELEVIRREIARHEREFTYYSVKHESTVHMLWQAMQAYRAMHI